MGVDGGAVYTAGADGAADCDEEEVCGEGEAVSELVCARGRRELSHDDGGELGGVCDWRGWVEGFDEGCVGGLGGRRVYDDCGRVLVCGGAGDAGGEGGGGEDGG